MNKFLISILSILVVFLASGCGKQPGTVSVDVIQERDAQTTQITTSTAHKAVAANPAPAATTAQQTVQIPTAFQLKIAFAQQAPFGNWDAVHEETCEEASMVMVARYLKNQPLDERIMEDELQKLVEWEVEHGYKVDLTAQETVDVLKTYFGISAHLSRSVTVDQIKYELSRGKPIIVPAAGRALANPNFKYPGPIYHMLVIKGYNSFQFITNDPGTRKGNGWLYAYDQLLNAIHDWNPVLAEGGMTEANMQKGERGMIVVDK